MPIGLLTGQQNPDDSQERHEPPRRFVVNTPRQVVITPACRRNYDNYTCDHISTKEFSICGDSATVTA